MLEPPGGESYHPQETLATKYDFSIRSSNTPLETSQIICLADNNHLAGHENYKGLLGEMLQPSDLVLVESPDVAYARQVYGIPENIEAVSWDNNEAYYLTLLLEDTVKRIDNAAIQAVISNLTSPNSSKHASTKQPRLKAVNEEIIKPLRDTYSVSARNADLSTHLQNQQNRLINGKRIIIIAGGRHFNQEFIDLLQQYSYSLLIPNNVAQLTEQQRALLLAQMSPEERAWVKRQWLASRK